MHVVDRRGWDVHAGGPADVVQRAADVVVCFVERVDTAVVVCLVITAADAHAHTSPAAVAYRDADIVDAATTVHDTTAVRTAAVRG